MVTKLLNEGAYPLAKNKEGHTPFDFTKVSMVFFYCNMKNIHFHHPIQNSNTNYNIEKKGTRSSIYASAYIVLRGTQIE